MALGIRLTWNRNTNDTVEYGVWRRTLDTQSVEVVRVPQPLDNANPVYEDMNVDIVPPAGPGGLSVLRPTESTAQLSWVEAADPANPTYYYSIRAYDTDGNYSPFCPEVSLQPSNAIDYYDWALIAEADGSTVETGTVPGTELQTPEVQVASGMDYHFEITAYDRAGNAGVKQISEVFTS